MTTRIFNKAVYDKLVTDLAVANTKNLKARIKDDDLVKLANRLDAQEGYKVFRANPFDVKRLSIQIKEAFAVAYNVPLTQRVESSLAHWLQYKMDDGHCCMPLESLLQMFTKQTSYPDVPTKDEIHDILMESDTFTVIEADHNYVYFTGVFLMEEFIAHTLRVASKVTVDVWPCDQVEHLIKSFEASHGKTLSPEQVEAVKMVFTESNIAVISGYPGTGKSTITTCIAYVACGLYNKNPSILYCAPTGIAANRLGNGEGVTIHRALKAMFIGNEFCFQKNEKDPLDYDIIILDEGSMLDETLFFKLLKAYKPQQSKLVILGDANQLPSVCYGDCFRHIIESKCVPHVSLKHIFRQSNGSLINELARSVIRGKIPSQTLLNNAETTWLDISNGEAINNAIQKLYIEHGDTLQIMIPCKNTTIGVLNVNDFIHKHKFGDTMDKFTEGDKVICIKNNIVADDNGEVVVAQSVSNGEIGFVEKPTKVAQTAPGKTKKKNGYKVVFPAHEKKVDIASDDLEYGYAITIHKSQGSEFDAALIVLHHSHSVMLNRQLLYTAITRAKKRLYIISSKPTLEKAINTKPAKRMTFLSSFIANDD
jgi:exodeoxyribonuclease V alpha subunit